MLRKHNITFLILIALAIPARAETSTNTTTGSCSPVVTGNKGAVTIVCTGTSDEVGEGLTAILNRILEKQLDPQLVISKLDEIGRGVDDLKRRAVDAERGVSSTYDFNGTKRETSAGRVVATMGVEAAVFQQMRDLNSKGEWKLLADLCEKQIVATPKWLTPYFFAGTAYANLGRKDEAVTRLQQVVDNAGNDPAYGQAKEFLARLRSPQ
jgi:hypothetical protein